MTTPAISVNEFRRGDYREVTTRLIPLPVQISTAIRQNYHTGVFRVRPASSPSPVRADGSRAPKAWRHDWFVYRAIPTRFTVTTGMQYGRTYTIEYPDGKPTGVVYPAVTLDVYRKGVCQQARFAWVGGTSLAEFPPAVMARATTSFRNAALEGAADLGVTLGEFRQTASYLGQLARSVESTVRGLTSASPKQLVANWANYSKKQLAEAKRKRVLETLYRGRVSRRLRRETQSAYRRRIAAERVVLQKWLEYQFAVRPLVMDLHSASEGLSYWMFDRGNPMRLTIKKGGSGSWTGRYSVTTGHGNGLAAGRIHESFEVQCKARAHYSAVFDIPPGTDRNLQQLGLTNPAAVLWEVTFLSWLVDYGIGIGNWLRSMTSMEHMEFVEGSLSLIGKVNTTDGRVRLNRDATHSNTWGVTGEGKCFVEGGRFERQVLSSTPLPAAFPAFKKGIGLTQVANALALFGGLGNPSLRI